MEAIGQSEGCGAQEPQGQAAGVLPDLHLYKVKKADNPVPPVQRIQLLSNTHFLRLPTSSKLGTESSECGAKKFQTALSVSEQRNQKYIQKSVSPLMACSEVTAAALCKLL